MARGHLWASFARSLRLLKSNAACLSESSDVKFRRRPKKAIFVAEGASKKFVNVRVSFFSSSMK